MSDIWSGQKWSLSRGGEMWGFNLQGRVRAPHLVIPANAGIHRFSISSQSHSWKVHSPCCCSFAILSRTCRDKSIAYVIWCNGFLLIGMVDQRLLCPSSMFEHAENLSLGTTTD